ncbi:MAG: AraC family ligand binding domain-containing protein, partial [Achromobacter sp.]|nr:AraC family ligand binding domain-containing protein [Achromobacter sp.]
MRKAASVGARRRAKSRYRAIKHRQSDMPVYSPDAVEDPDLVACPVVGMAIDTRAHASDWHAHQRAQLLYQAEGGVTLYLTDRVGQLAPLQAAWLPAGCVHRTAMQGTFAYRSLYFDVAVYPDLPREPRILDVNPLLREMIVRVTQWPSDQALDGPRQRLVGALLDELAAAPAAPLHLPMPRDRRLAPNAREGKPARCRSMKGAAGWAPAAVRWR